MNKIMKFILLPMSVLAALGSAVGGALLIRQAIKTDKTPEAELLPDVPKNEIVYLMSRKDGDIIEEIPEFLFKEDGAYPTSYATGTKVLVSDLNGRVTRNWISISGWGDANPWDDVDGEDETWTLGTETGWYPDPNDPNKEYEFKGWYMDSECTQAFKGFFPAAETTRKVLYADIGIARWTDPY